jgi:hypothetical protein
MFSLCHFQAAKRYTTPRKMSPAGIEPTFKV